LKFNLRSSLHLREDLIRDGFHRGFGFGIEDYGGSLADAGPTVKRLDNPIHASTLANMKADGLRFSTRTALRLVGLVVVGLLVGILFQSTHGPARVSIRLLGCPKDTDGTEFALLTVTNASRFPVFVYRPIIEVQAPSEPGGLSYVFQGGTNQWFRLHLRLAGGASENFKMPMATNRVPWRVSVLVYNDVGTVPVILRRLMMSSRHMPACVRSDWFDRPR
jgi:hypothetical protein